MTLKELQQDGIDSIARAPQEQRATFWMTAVLAIVSLMPLGWTIQSAYMRLTQPNPQSPWEAEILVDAYRAHHHLPVYTLPQEDHATHMYGPLITYVSAPFIGERDFSPRPPRVVAIVSATMSALIASLCLARGRGVLLCIMGFSLLLMQFYRTRAMMAEGRPDAAAAALGALALWLFYLSHTRRTITSAILFLILGVIAMLTGLGFKQTAAGMSIIPMLSVLVTRPKPFARHFAMAAVPPACIAITILGLHRSPALFFYVVRGQTLFHFRAGEWPFDLINVLTTNVLFDVAFVLWLLGICTPSISRGAMAWLLVTLVITALSSSAAVAKVGGQSNSYLTIFLAMAVFTLVMLPDMFAKLATLARTRPRQIAAVAFLSIALLADATGVAGYYGWATGVNVFGDKNYKNIVRRARALKGKVICPDDPTIPLRAKGRLDRNHFCELDALGWTTRPAYMVNELKTADYVILIHGVWTPTISPAALTRRGFKQVADPVFKDTVYTLFQRKSRLTTRPSSRPIK